MTAIDVIASCMPTNMYLNVRRLHSLAASPKQHFYRQSLKVSQNSRGYSFNPFVDTRSIFVHIPKCAGISVNKALYGCLAGGHTTLQQYLTTFDPRTLDQLFKFTIVRNPWDRVVSAYHFLQHGGFDEHDRQWFQRELSHYTDFSDFVRRWLNRDNVWTWNHFKPQHHFMLERRNRMTLDFIGYFENLAADFEYIAERVNPGATLPALNRCDHLSYEHYYTEETRAIVADVYAEDIKALGYTFDNSSLKQQIEQRDLRLRKRLEGARKEAPFLARLRDARSAWSQGDRRLPIAS